MFEQMQAPVPSSMQQGPSVSASKTALIAKQIEVLFSAYRRADYADPVGFVAQLGVILQSYPDDVILYITEPLTGLQRRQTFPPSIPEVVKACDDRVAELHRLQQAEEWAERKRESDRLRHIPPVVGQETNVSANGGRLINWQEWQAEFGGRRVIGRFEPSPKFEG